MRHRSQHRVFYGSSGSVDVLVWILISFISTGLLLTPGIIYLLNGLHGMRIACPNAWTGLVTQVILHKVPQGSIRNLTISNLTMSNLTISNLTMSNLTMSGFNYTISKSDSMTSKLTEFLTPPTCIFKVDHSIAVNVSARACMEYARHDIVVVCIVLDEKDKEVRYKLRDDTEYIVGETRSGLGVLFLIIYMFVMMLTIVLAIFESNENHVYGVFRE